MNEKTQHVATGAFVIGALVIAIATLFYLLGSGFREGEKFVMVFDGAAKGLNIGAPISLRGVEIGEVTDVDVVLNAETAEVFVVVEGEIDESSLRYDGDPDKVTTEDLIARGLRAQLNLLSLLTGMLYIELDFYPNSEIRFTDLDLEHEQFPTIPTNLERLAKKLDGIDFAAIAGQLEELSAGLNAFFTSEEFKSLPGNLNDTLASVADLSEQLQDQLARSGPRIDSVLDEAIAAMSKANEELAGAINTFEASMGSIEGLVSEDSATLVQLNTTMQDVSRASRALRQLATTLETQPEAVLQGKGGE